MLIMLIFPKYLKGTIRYAQIYLYLLIPIVIYFILDGVIFVSICPHDGSIKSLVTHHLFQIIPVEREICMLYIASIIPYGIFLELLWNPTLCL